MPIPQTIRVNPLDLQKNIAIGVSLPFNGPAVFNSTFTTKDQIKSNLINLLLTNKGERVMNPEFGADIKRSLFEAINDDLSEEIIEKINTNVSIFVPEVNITNIEIVPSPDSNSIEVTIQYTIEISGTPDQIKIQFT